MELRMELQRRDDRMINMITTMNKNLKRVLHQPAHPLARVRRTSGISNVGDAQARNGDNHRTEEEMNNIQIGGSPAELSARPKNIYSLWHEYEFGLGNRKAAKEFTAIERGRVKHIYCKRKIVWDVIANLVNGGWTSKRAIDKIYEVYGSVSVTKIIAAMKQDKERGGHPSLKITRM